MENLTPTTKATIIAALDAALDASPTEAHNSRLSISLIWIRTQSATYNVPGIADQLLARVVELERRLSEIERALPTDLRDPSGD